jgi:hypothetical protein
MFEYGMSMESRIIFSPSLRSLTWVNQEGIDWPEEPGVCAVEELSIAGPSAPSGVDIPSIEFSNLKRLTITYSMSYAFLYLLDEQFGGAKRGEEEPYRRLELIRLINLTDSMYKELAKLSFVRNARRILLDAKLKPGLFDEAFHHVWFLPEAKKFLEACDPHTEVVAFDETTGKLMAVARSLTSSTGS